MAGLTLTKSELAERLAVTKGRVSQLLADGLPVEADGRVDALAAAEWVLSNLNNPKAEPTRQAARELMVQAHTWNALAYAAAEIPVAVVLAGAEVGLRREAAERLGDLTALLFWAAMNEPLEAEGLPEGIHAAPDAVLAWRKRVNWEALFGPDGESLVAGRIEAASRAELAEEAGTAEVERPE
jgi:transcriptional regulator with XRE-family HTH domain